MARTAPLTVVKGGIDRGRPKGGVRADVLYDLVNAQITEEYKLAPREGSVRTATLTAGTVGLVAFGGELHVFASTAVAVPSGYVLNILLHPFDSISLLTEIHFAEPFMGALYVVAEFDDDQIYHFWLQEGDEWAATTEIAANEFRTPTTPNGYVYRAIRLTQPYPAWTAGAPRALADIIEPTVYNEYYYTVIDTQGDTPTSGSVEPVWPTETGETIIENVDGFDSSGSGSSTPPTPPAPNTPQASTTERYG